MHRRAAAALAGRGGGARRAAHLAAAGDDDEAAGPVRRRRGRANSAPTRCSVPSAWPGRPPAWPRRPLPGPRPPTRWPRCSPPRAAGPRRSASTRRPSPRAARPPNGASAWSSAALEAGYPDRARACWRAASDGLPLTRVLAGRVALVGGDAPTALAEADAVLAQNSRRRYRLAALDIRARALDYLGERAAARRGVDRPGGAGRGGRPDPGRAAGPLPARQAGVLRRASAGPGSAKRSSSRAAPGALIELAWAEETLAIALALQGDPAAALEVLEVAIPRARELRLDQLGFLLCAQAGALSFTRPNRSRTLRRGRGRRAGPDLLLITAGIRADIALQHGRYDEAVIAL